MERSVMAMASFRRWLLVGLFAALLPAQCLADAGRPDNRIGQWVASDEQAMTFHRDKAGKLVMLRERGKSRTIMAREVRGIFAPTPAGRPLFGSSKWRAHFHGDYLVLTRLPSGLPPDTDIARPGKYGIMVWRKHDVSWPQYHCHDDTWNFQLRWEADFRAGLRFLLPDGSVWRACSLRMDGLSYCPGCRGLSESQPYVVTDQCHDEPAALRSADRINIKNTLEPKMRIEPHFRYRGDFSSIKEVSIREGMAVVPCEIMRTGKVWTP